jgi:predicted TIM-barrel fold metal-dependent hydrolase
MNLFDISGTCDSHSHVYGPFDRFPLALDRAFDPPQAPLEQLETVWKGLGVERAVLIQGAAYGTDLAALLAGIAEAPEVRRGVAVIASDASPSLLQRLHAGGVRAVRLNWSRHLLKRDARSDPQLLEDVIDLLQAIAPLGWHVEAHIDPEDLHWLDALEVPAQMPVVIDHMARISLSSPDAEKYLDRLLALLKETRFWVKLSGADRMASHSQNLRDSLPVIQRAIAAAPERCVWGLDWPHVNLERRRTDADLALLLKEAAGDDRMLHNILVANPERLYGFVPLQQV